MISIILSIIALGLAASNYNRFRDIRDKQDHLSSDLHALRNDFAAETLKSSQRFDSQKDKLANMSDKIEALNKTKNKPGRPKVKK